MPKELEIDFDDLARKIEETKYCFDHIMDYKGTSCPLCNRVLENDLKSLASHPYREYCNCTSCVESRSRKG